MGYGVHIFAHGQALNSDACKCAKFKRLKRFTNLPSLCFSAAQFPP